jgi:hypothetical protein
MMRTTFSSLTLSVSLVLAGGSVAVCYATETDDSQPPITQSRTLEDYLNESATDFTDEEPALNGPGETSKPTANADTFTTRNESKTSTVESAKELSKSPAEFEKDNSDAFDFESTGSKLQVDTQKNEKNAIGAPATSELKTEKKSPPSLTPELLQLREQVRDCLGYYYNDIENVVDHSPWGIMHVLIAYGVDTQIYANGSRANAIGYLCWNGTCRGQQLFYVNRGKLEARLGPGVQGHDGQFLAMMAQSRVSMNYPMRVEGRDFTLADLVEYEKRSCEAGTELTFKLIALSHYLDTDTTWKNQNGQDWSIPRLIKEELAQPIIGAACGGTHRLMGFNYAVRKREKEGKPIKGQYQRARKFLDDYFEYTYYLQNEDGSFSTDFFRGRNSYGDINQRIETTGHILEWFVASLSNEQLRDPRVVKSVSYLTNLMLRDRTHNWEIGPKGHALHALAIYDERVFGGKPGSRNEVLSRSKKKHVDDRTQR